MSSSEARPVDLNLAIVDVRRELGEVRQVKKCSGCECLFDVLNMVGDDLAAIGTPEAQEAEVEVRAWLDARPAQAHGCLGCAICLPVPPYNRFSELLKASQPEAPAAPAASAAACGCGDT
jgi:hypothetical protein